MNGKRKPRRPVARQIAVAKPLQVPPTLRHVHRPRDFGVGYGNSSGYGHDWHFGDGHVDPMFRCT
ncbi:MAG: hypothetical protein ACOH1R_10405 [Luteimonas sp.]